MFAAYEDVAILVSKSEGQKIMATTLVSDKEHWGTNLDFRQCGFLAQALPSLQPKCFTFLVIILNDTVILLQWHLMH